VGEDGPFPQEHEGFPKVYGEPLEPGDDDVIPRETVDDVGADLEDVSMGAGMFGEGDGDDEASRFGVRPEPDDEVIVEGFDVHG